MTRTEYMEQLEKHLKKLPHKEYQAAVNYFKEYFDDAGPEGEVALIEELGTPKEAASDIINNILDRHIEDEMTAEQKSKTKTIWLALLALLSLPIAVPLLLCLIGALLLIISSIVGLILLAFGLGLSLIVTGSYLIWEALSLFNQSLPAFLMGFGTGIGLIGGAAILYVVTGLFAYWSGRLVKTLFQWILKRGKTA
ncbi:MULTISPECIES: DUF1700 domain-containing protein [unclassified Streptococcus]|uniref:DUF1700 domain-containing protein n=1 Tax=unclassified Streptococcus TaxID=2608887 RepID=UPI0010721068|nr:MULTISPECIES: DUF1700 domain-containing protein [unclassified Streptococcus]MBF0788053.1 DUF1700 domain-containing protein [Streptococcus sp. 19428wC2_LYSM12]MCQ9211866.1 DUF1700 domain-containing protein [Streptococcus sp. B01]MCQ9212987.1 DUF1700 domain-containing protein [Streptococcus sp. O1]TFV04925.1 DUF1700 domain-containing protein [Streptococcus sp. LYSM12]